MTMEELRAEFLRSSVQARFSWTVLTYVVGQQMVSWYHSAVSTTQSNAQSTCVHNQTLLNGKEHTS